MVAITSMQAASVNDDGGISTTTTAAARLGGGTYAAIVMGVLAALGLFAMVAVYACPQQSDINEMNTHVIPTTAQISNPTFVGPKRPNSNQPRTHGAAKPARRIPKDIDGYLVDDYSPNTQEGVGMTIPKDSDGYVVDNYIYAPSAHGGGRRNTVQATMGGTIYAIPFIEPSKDDDGYVIDNYTLRGEGGGVRAISTGEAEC